MKILLAGPGTGKTTKIKSIIDTEYAGTSRIKVISFTNATINDLTESFNGYTNVSCSTLHSFALGLNHLPELHILIPEEEKILEYLSHKIDIPLLTIYELLKCITFEGMIHQCVSFINANPAYAEEKVGNIELLIVDEFQDFNPVESELILQISKLSKETLILGDDDQTIYGFKDADPNAIIQMYNDSNIVKIPHNNICYRCPDSVVDFCSKLIQENKNRVAKPWQKSNKPGEVIRQQFITQEECDEYIFQQIKAIQAQKQQASILVLSPVGFAADTLKEKFKNNQVDFNDCWGESFNIDLLSKIWWLRVIYTPNKLLNLIFLLRYYNLLGRVKINRLLKSKFESGFDENIIIDEIISLAYLPEPFATYIRTPININEFLKKHTEYDSLKEFLIEDNLEFSISRLIKSVKVKNEFEKGKINLMSIHKSKGLQADYVFINGLVSGILPNETRGIDTIEAQRRLLFVGMTRALKKLYLMSTVEWDGKEVHKVDKSQFKYNFVKKKWRGQTSKFIKDIS